MTVSLVTPPAALPVSMTELREYILTAPDEDANLLLSLMTAAVGKAQSLTGLTLVTSVWDMRLDAFPVGDEAIELGTPLQGVASISYADAEGDTQSMDSISYVVDTFARPGKVWPAYGTEWPEARSQRNAVVIRYTAGWDVTAGVWAGPADISTWIKLRTSSLYEHRDALAQLSRQNLIAAIPRDFVDGLLDDYVVRGAV